jgi:hypothetical protein
LGRKIIRGLTYQVLAKCHILYLGLLRPHPGGTADQHIKEGKNAIRRTNRTVRRLPGENHYNGGAD